MNTGNRTNSTASKIELPVMMCKLKLHSMSENDFSSNGPGECSTNIRMGAVWEGSTEKQQASENAVFGKMTPMAEFNAIIRNPSVVQHLKEGKSYYVTFYEAPDEE